MTTLRKNWRWMEGMAARWLVNGDRLAPAYAVQVMVWFDTWRGHWTSEKYASKGDALLACLEAAPC